MELLHVQSIRLLESSVLLGTCSLSGNSVCCGTKLSNIFVQKPKHKD